MTSFSIAYCVNGRLSGHLPANTLKHIRANLLLVICMLSHSNQSQSQHLPRSHEPEKKSSIDLQNSNNNIVTVIQKGKTVIYNIADDSSFHLFIRYIKSLRNFKPELDEVLADVKETKEIVKKMYARAKNAEGDLDVAKLLDNLETYKKENENLLRENDSLLIFNKSLEFGKSVKEANTKLLIYDNIGYQNVLDSFINNEKGKITYENLKVASALYLKSQNNYSTYRFVEAMHDIVEALMYDAKNPIYLFQKGKINHELKQYDNSITSYKAAIAYSSNDSLTSDAYCLLAQSYHDNNEYDSAISNYLIGICIQERLSLSNVSHSYNNIGYTYQAKGNLDKSIFYYHKALLLELSKHPKPSIAIIALRNNIGLVYMEQSVYDTALNYFYSALREGLSTQKNDFSSLSTTYNNIGLSHQYLEKYDSTLFYYSKALSILKDSIGIENSQTAVLYSNIGSAYNNLGDYKKALLYHDSALSIRKKIFSTDNVGIANSYERIGQIYIQHNNPEMGLKFSFLALPIYERIVGKDHKRTVIVYTDIGQAYLDEGKSDSAFYYYKKAVPNEEKAFGRNSRDCATFYYRLSYMYYQRNDFTLALRFALKALPIREKVAGKYDTTTIIYCHNIGSIFYSLDNYPKSFEYLSDALNRENHLTDTLNNRKKMINLDLGALLIAEGKPKDGLLFLEKSDYSRQSFCQRASSISNTADLIFNTRNNKKALNFYSLAATILEQSAPSNSDLLWTHIYFRLAICYCSLGNGEKAKYFLNKGLYFDKYYPIKSLNYQNLVNEAKKCN
jgi:tetratricopeptide (TPR) repeat protein